ncbi:hypothetical protein tb265_01500 [Gemmatimonadetes bacterium T265]|nr:hypothetical protein tb265_01500 [Gemmatimonadetes bacterium T265]
MSQYTSRRFALRGAALAATAGAFALGACSSGDKGRQNDAALNQDTALARDLSLANQQPAAQPQLQDVPATPPPATAAPAPAPAPAPRREVIREVIRERPARTASSSSAPRRTNPAAAPDSAAGTRPAPNNAERGGVGTIPAGTTLLLASNRSVCTNNTSVGDHFTASVSDAVSGSNGATIPAGATANVEVTSVSGSGSANDAINLGLRVVSLSYGGHTYAVSATTESADVTRVKNGGASKDPQKVIGGAVAGAILGRIIGGGAKGTIIGAAAGTAAGAGVASATARYEGCLNSGASMHVRLTDGVQVRLARAGGTTDPGI